MSPWDKQIADAAIAAEPASTHTQLESDISAAANVSLVQVKKILDRLVSDGYIFLRGGPSQNRAEDLYMPSPPPATIWYEKGRDW